MQSLVRMGALVAALILVTGVAVVAGDPDDGGHVGVGDENGDPQPCPPGLQTNPCGSGTGNGGVGEPTATALCEVPSYGQGNAELELNDFLECEAEGIGGDDGPEDDGNDPDDYYAFIDHGILHMHNIGQLCFREDNPLYQWNEIGLNVSEDTVVKIREFEETPIGDGVVEVWLNGHYHVTSTSVHSNPKTVEQIFDDLEDLIDNNYTLSRTDDYLVILQDGHDEEVETVSIRITDSGIVTTEMAIEPYTSDWDDTSCN